MRIITKKGVKMMEINIPNLPFINRSKDKEYRLSTNDVVMVTARGKEAAENDAYSGSRAQILIAVNDRGAVSVGELARGTRLTTDKVKAVLNDLMMRAEVRKVGYEG